MYIPAIGGLLLNNNDDEDDTVIPPVDPPVEPPVDLPVEPPIVDKFNRDEHVAAGVLNIVDRGETAATTIEGKYDGLGETNVPDYDQYDAKDVSTTIDTNTDVEDGLLTVDQDKSTVAGQLTSLLDTDSPYIQQARLQGERDAAGRGMLNSSMAAGASQAAAIQAAQPIAAQDAQTYAKAQAVEQAATIENNKIQVEGIVSGGLSDQANAAAGADQRVQNIFTAEIAGADAGAKAILTGYQQSNNLFIQEMAANDASMLQDKQLTADKINLGTTLAAGFMQNYAVSLENLMTDPEFLALGEEAGNHAVAELQGIARGGMRLTGELLGVDLTDIADNALPAPDLLIDGYMPREEDE